MKIGKQEFFPTKQTAVMGILNVTPDSFSDGGQWDTTEKAVAHAQDMLLAGVDIIDIGGESTRPGHTQISEAEEIARVVPVIHALKAMTDVPLSIDTYKATVAEAALQAGADMVNDIWGLKADDRMANVVKEYDVPVCLMHNRTVAQYEDFEREYFEDLEACMAIAKAAGIKEEKLILDPGIGFGKTYEQNMWAIANIDRLGKYGYPVLLATSRKRFIERTIHVPVDERLEGTLATTVYGVLHGCSFVRVHDVKENKRIIGMTEGIKNYQKEPV